MPDKEKLKLGEQILITKEYFSIAFDEIYTAGHILIFNCWRQWAKTDIDSAYSELLETTFECLKNELTLPAKKIAYFSTSLKTNTSEEEDTLLRAKFNYLIALKKLGELEELQNQLNLIKIATLSPMYQLAYYILKDDKIKIKETIPHCKVVNKMSLDWIHEWPLFEGIRKDPTFLKEIEDTYHSC